MPAFMYLCGIVSFSLSFSVTFGIESFRDSLETDVVSSFEMLADNLEAVEGDVGDELEGRVMDVDVWWRAAGGSGEM